MNTVLKEDIDNIVKTFDFKLFEGQTVLITGASGLLGKIMTLAFLKAGIEVIALVRNEQKAKNVLGKNEKLTFLVQDIKDAITYNGKVDYIIHTASVTASKEFVEKPVETIFTTLKGVENVLNFAKEKNVKSFVYLSSLEVYGIEGLKNQVNEDDFGYLNPTQIRSSYSESKRMAECLAISYGKEYQVPVKIARLAQTFGAGVEYNDNRVFAYFLRTVLENKDIVLHTDGSTERNYCYTTDAVKAILTILLNGENNNAYNVANSDIYISIKDMAQMLVKKNTQIDLKFEINNKDYGFNPTIKVNLDTTKLKSLGWSAQYGIEEMLNRTFLSLKSDFNQLH